LAIDEMIYLRHSSKGQPGEWESGD
jgi:hypothetical protein